MLTIWQRLRILGQFSGNVTRKSSRVTTIFVVCLISLPILLIVKSLSLHFFKPFGNYKTLKEESSHNTSSQSLERTTCNVTTSVLDTQINSSKPPIIDEVQASGFNKGSCLSRDQATSYRKHPRYKPSSYLKSKLSSYEKLHARCGPHSVSYQKTTRKLSRWSNVQEMTACKYLVWRPSNGLGNRMVSIASAFLYALLKNRVLLLEFEADMNGLFCEPFPNSSWILPHNFPHKSHWSDLPSFNKSRVNPATGSIPPFLRVDLQHSNGDPNIQHFHCNDTQSLLDKIPALVLLSDQYFVPSLFMIPSLQEELNRMFPEKVGTVFHHLGNYLFHPSNEVWGLITRFYDAYLSKADEKIGLQIRTFNHKVSQQTIMDHILSCTLQNGILPSITSVHDVVLDNHTSESKAVLVASLNSEYAEELRNMYWIRPTITRDVIGVYQPSHEEHQKFKDNMHNIKAWAEIYLLSLCDVLVTTPLSTFGYVAHSLGGLKPWIMDQLQSERVPSPACKQGSSIEPCFHVPPKYDCSGKFKIDNISVVYPHLMPCEDVWWGVKLADML